MNIPAFKTSFDSYSGDRMPLRKLKTIDIMGALTKSDNAKYQRLERSSENNLVFEKCLKILDLTNE